MKTPIRANNVNPDSGPPEEKLSQKKDGLLERLSKDAGSVKLDKKELVAERKRRAEEVEKLEEENNAVAQQVRDLQRGLLKKRVAAKEVFEKSDALKRKLVGLLGKKRGLLNEIEFYETEKARLHGTFLKVSESLSNNVSTLNSTLKNLEFMKGEVRALMGKTTMLEGEIPVKYRDRGNLDEKIDRTLNLLDEFYNRMQRVEKTIKEIYYKKNKQNE